MRGGVQGITKDKDIKERSCDGSGGNMGIQRELRQENEGRWGTWVAECG
jgi:hypothetical protein